MKLFNLDFSNFFTILYNEQKGDYLTVTIGFILLIGGIICFAFGLFDAIKFSQTTDAKVIKSEPSYKTKRGQENVYFNTYEYIVKNKKYRIEIKELEREINYTTQLHYNKNNPKQARITNNKKMFVVAIIIICLSIITIIKGFEIANELNKISLN